MPDVDTLRFIWWLLLGFILMGFAITDGWDIGISALYPFIARNETDRRVVLNTLAQFWEGNQVWIILGAGAFFAAWPLVYAVAFSGFYFIILLLLLTMGIIRPVSIKYRNKLDNPVWQSCWDTGVFCSGLFPALIFGILIGNVLQGIPFHFDEQLQLTYNGSFLSLLNPFAWWCGITSLMMLMMQGATYLIIKTENPINRRAIFMSRIAALLLIFFFLAGGLWIFFTVPGYEVITKIAAQGYSSPLHKQIIQKTGAWLMNYSSHPLTLWAPILGVLGALGVILTASFGSGKLAFFCSSLSVIGIIATVGVSMFPFIIPSSMDTYSSLLVWDASSTQLTLFVMLIAALIFIPLILMYTSWVFYVLRGKITG